MSEPRSRCGKPLVNEHNWSIQRKYIYGGLATSAVLGGFIGAVALSAIGFTSAGVAAGSFAAAWQGPLTAAGSTFAVLQSLGATGLGSVLFGTVGTLTTGGTALFVLTMRRQVGLVPMRWYSGITTTRRKL